MNYWYDGVPPDYMWPKSWLRDSLYRFGQTKTRKEIYELYSSGKVKPLPPPPKENEK